VSDSTPSVGSPTELALAPRPPATSLTKRRDGRVPGVAHGATAVLRGRTRHRQDLLAAALAEALHLPLIRLQCHEGIDAAQALWYD
jgi:hypothetical protein